MRDQHPGHRGPRPIGHGAIVSARLEAHKELLYNGSKMPTHPVATLRLRNETGLTLEGGPVTVLDRGEYVGEAVLPFTATEGEIVVPYTVELGAKVREESGVNRELNGLRIDGYYLASRSGMCFGGITRSTTAPSGPWPS